MVISHDSKCQTDLLFVRHPLPGFELGSPRLQTNTLDELDCLAMGPDYCYSNVLSYVLDQPFKYPTSSMTKVALRVFPPECVQRLPEIFVHKKDVITFLGGAGSIIMAGFDHYLSVTRVATFGEEK